MIDSARLRHEGDQAAGRTAKMVVEPDAGGQGQEAHATRPEPFWSAGTVALQAEQVLEGLEDRLDALADAPQVGTRARRLIPPGRADHVAAELGHGALEAAPDIALVADHELAAAQAARQEIEGHRALLLI